MQLALVLNRYECEFICDLAEYYHILDYKSINPGLAGVLLQGLKPESRTKMKLSKQKLTIEQTLLAIIADGVTYLVWMNGNKKKTNKPKSILNLLLEDKEKPNKCKGFKSAAEFERTWQKITGVGHG